ncbi:MAG: tetratricopeptide repeat protein [Pseudomonadota bacterium]
MVRKIKPTKDERKASVPSVDAPDEFLSLSQRAFDWMAGNSKLVLSVIGALLVIGIVYGSMSTYNAHVDGKASLVLAEVIRAERGQVDLTGAVKPEPNGDPVFKSDEEKAKAVREAAEKVIAAYPSHSSSAVARLYLGRACLDTGDADCAVDACEKAVAQFAESDPLRNTALLALAAAQELKGLNEQAAQSYARVADGKQSYGKDVGLYHAARVAMAAGDKDRARGYLERIESDFTDSVYKTDAASMLEGLK